jgi:hypothetical protein
MNSRKSESDEEARAFLPQPTGGEDAAMSSKEMGRPSRRVWQYLRLVLEAVMAVSIAYLVFRPMPGSETLRKSPVPRSMGDARLQRGFIADILLSSKEVVYVSQ